MDIISYKMGQNSIEPDKPDQTKTADPSTQTQVITPDAGYELASVTINPVTSAIDSNIASNNIKAGVTILGVEGNVEPDKPDQTKTVNPSTSSQTITPDTGYELASVTVNAVTSSIDANIQAENIKKDVTILGVTGTVEEGGGSAISEKDVNFYDYDGTLTNSYTKQEFLQLTEMPENPTHTGLTAQGWNWTLSDAKTFVNDYDILDIGQMYVTDDNKTRIYITLEDGGLSPYLGLSVNGTATIEWGDGTTNTVTGTSTSYQNRINTQHTYSSAGNYVISISSATQITLSGDGYQSCVLWNNNSSAREKNRVYQNAITKIECGNNLSFVYTTFGYCWNLKTIATSKGLSSVSGVNNTAKLKCLIIPDSVTSYSSISSNPSLEIISIPKNSITSINNATFQNNTALRRLIIPNNITTLGNNIVYECDALEKLILPNSITSIGTGLTQESHLSELKVPNNITSLPNLICNSNYALKKIIFSNNLTTIGQSCFLNCYSLGSIKMPKTVNNIGSQAFQNNYGASYYDFSEHTSIPTLGQNAFYGINSTTKIIVPDSLYSTWKTTSGWSTYASNIISKSDWDALQV